eukprot:jgi/Psemu1/304991/fgenesh1_kg.178_\
MRYATGQGNTSQLSSAQLSSAQHNTTQKYIWQTSLPIHFRNAWSVRDQAANDRRSGCRIALFCLASNDRWTDWIGLGWIGLRLGVKGSKQRNETRRDKHFHRIETI